MVSSEIVSKLQNECRKFRYELCGIISSAGTVHPIKNRAARPDLAFVMDKTQYITALQQIEDAGDSVLCLYHTHPFTPPDPSTKDQEFFARSRYNMLIVSPTDWRYMTHE